MPIADAEFEAFMKSLLTDGGARHCERWLFHPGEDEATRRLARSSCNTRLASASLPTVSPKPLRRRITIGSADALGSLLSSCWAERLAPLQSPPRAEHAPPHSDGYEPFGFEADIVAL